MQVPVSVGDRVRPYKSSMTMTGHVVAKRNENYLVVEWQTGIRGTHHRDSLEYVGREFGPSANRFATCDEPV